MKVEILKTKKKKKQKRNQSKCGIFRRVQINLPPQTCPTKLPSHALNVADKSSMH